MQPNSVVKLEHIPPVETLKPFKMTLGKPRQSKMGEIVD